VRHIIRMWLPQLERINQRRMIGMGRWGPGHGTWPFTSPDLNPIEIVWHRIRCAGRPISRAEKGFGASIARGMGKVKYA